ncbi:FAD/NAD(P)-binding domain-containing protein [Amniculicola lignicola CBS 123094]|uniref:FAD/NAD(P)-binding domain-containing protein n=1 Tax=Amniculicola lignicola CBS 123094 TaxID=1392246 RepID=A0A6A5X5Y3_9PLEO|nr:FAD/NAD(P)-binding domain-containing protein [Amniculicola lignicola CBS 123094]
MDNVELVVVGAGLYGINAAVTYYRLHPTAHILVVDAGPFIGGPWAPHRIFPGLKTNNLWGTYESPDYPMDEKRFGVKKNEHVPAEKVTDYMNAMVNDSGINGFIRVNTKVETITQTPAGWKLHCVSTAPKASARSYTINTAKLILSIGLTNRPSMPRYPSSPEFKSEVIHSKDFPSRFSSIVRPYTHTLVVGAGKSAWDVAYACATQPGSTATMLIRPSGNGPAYMSPTHVTPLGLWLEKLVFTRFFGFMSPCPWAETSGWEGIIRRFLHGTTFGRKIVRGFWWVLGDDVVQLNKMNDDPEVKKLRPWRSAFETGNALSILNYPTNFFDLVKEGRIKVVIGEVDHLGDEKEVWLKSGVTGKVDAIVCATGWEHGSSLKFKPEGLERQLGLPTNDDTMPPEDTALINEVETSIYERYPYLKERDSSRMYHPDPDLRHAQTINQDVNQQPFRLWRFLVPPSDLQRRSIGFSGALMTLGNAPCAYIQSLWLTAYLDGTLTLPKASPEQFKHDAYVDTQYCALRNTMGYGAKFPDLVFDSLPYFDVLMRDLGFEGKRKGSFLGLRNWLGECFRSYGPADYRGLVEMWKKRLESKDEKGKKKV